MAREHGAKMDLPTWLNEVQIGEATDVVLGKRYESRRNWQGSCFAQSDDEADGARFLVCGVNRCSGGFGGICRQDLSIGQQLVITPVAGVGKPVRVRVMHCRRTVQGYRVGCVFEPTPSPGCIE